MLTMTLSLPELLMKFINEQVQSGRYMNVHDYMSELIRLDEKKKSRSGTEVVLCDGLSSEASEMTEKDWALCKLQLKKYKPKSPVKFRTKTN